MNTAMISPAIEAGFNVLREHGNAGTPRREAEALAGSILDNEWQALGLAEAHLNEAALQWWGVGAHEALMESYQDGLRERARAALAQHILDVRTPVNVWDDPRLPGTRGPFPDIATLPLRQIEFDEDWLEAFIEEAASAADLPPEDIVNVVAEFCPVRDRDYALICASLELRTYHRFRPSMNEAEPEPEADQQSDCEILAFAAAKSATDEPDGAPSNEELGTWVKRLTGMENAREARTALFQLQQGIAPTAKPTAPPVDLWQRHEAPDLPPRLLPAVIERFAFDHAAIMGADPAGLAMSALGVCGAAINDSISLQVKHHDATWRENARLWVGLVGMPSTKKTPIMNAAMAPLRRLDAAMAQRNAEAMRDYKSLPKVDQACAPEPKQPRHVVEDATIESLQQVLADSPHGVLSIQDELTGWFGAMDKYNPGKGSAADRAFWLKAFNGGQYSVNRVMRGSVLIPNLSIALLGGVQPDPLRKIAGESVDDGLIQRFLPVVLRAATTGRDAPSGEAVGDYHCLVERLVQLAPPKSGNLDAGRAVMFSVGARAVRERLEAEHVALVMALEGVSPKLASHFGKLDGIFARLCLLWHCVEHVDGPLPPEVSGDVAERVARFMEEFLRPNAIAFYAGLLGMSAGHEDLMALAAFIVSDGLTEVSAREVQRSTRALRHVTADDARRLCEKLEAFGWLFPSGANGKGVTTRWRVIPEVHAMFAERGRQESERRAAARAAIAEALRP